MKAMCLTQICLRGIRWSLQGNLFAMLVPEIRNLYKPVQPTASHVKGVSYQEFLPDPQLNDHIYCYWRLRAKEPLSLPFTYRVVADGCIDIFFEPGVAAESFAMGFCKKYTEFALESRFDYFGIRFLPTIFPQLFGINASLLSNRVENLEVILPQISTFIANSFASADEDSKITEQLDLHFREIINGVKFKADARFSNALSHILQNEGNIDVEKDLQSGISQRQLRRLFRFYLGTTAKTFSQVVRFQKILNAPPSSIKDKLFFDAGYYDQSHFIKEFRNFYGITPSKAFGR